MSGTTQDWFKQEFFNSAPALGGFAEAAPSVHRIGVSKP
jgi:hypothetical protein